MAPVEKLEQRIEEQRNQLERQSSLLEELAAENAKLQRDNRRLNDELQVLLNRLFRRSSERIDPHQLQLFATGEPEAAEEIAPPAPAPAKDAGRKNGHGRAPFRKDLPRIPVELDLPAQDRHCDECGKDLNVIGCEVTERGHLIPAKVVVKQYRRPKYACPDGHQVKTAPLPSSLIEKCKYEPSVYAHLAVAKYGDHLPLHRLEGIYKRQGFHLPRSTMWEMLSRLDEVVTSPILAQMRRELLELPRLQADETPITVQLEEQRGAKKAYLWTYGWDVKRMFDFTMTRERDGPVAFLEDWEGTLQTDGYSGYDEVVRRNGLVRAGCWAHARRKLKEALDTGSHSAARLLVPVQRLFRVEAAIARRAEARALDEEALRRLRQEVRGRTSRRILDRIHALVHELWEERSTLPKSLLGKALTYLDRQWDVLQRFLEDPHLPIHNNDAERTIRHVAVGRKNWLFFGSQRGAHVGKNLISLVLTCKALDVNPEEYLLDLIQSVDTTPQSQIASLTPWAWAEQRQQRVATAN